MFFLTYKKETAIHSYNNVIDSSVLGDNYVCIYCMLFFFQYDGEKKHDSIFYFIALLHIFYTPDWYLY